MIQFCRWSYVALQFRDTIAKLHTVNCVLGPMWHYNIDVLIKKLHKVYVSQHGDRK
jgi:hypothetical protein